GSMGDYRQLAVAKRELLASINSFDSTQQFHVLFYNNTYEQMTLNGKPPGLQWATDINKTLAGQFIKRMTPEGGTTHLPALMKALSYRPEHLYFLTDATEPLSAAALNDIRQANRGRTQIHCVEFGKGGDLALDNYLKRLARQNGGTYRYRDVRSF
ncbi:MAG: vWA domain-containing protein, partial [Planctomycetota bacterium]